jgi:hypothetical protein
MMGGTPAQESKLEAEAEAEVREESEPVVAEAGTDVQKK